MAPSLIAAGISGMFSLAITLLYLRNRRTRAGEHSSSHREIPLLLPRIWSLYISIALAPKTQRMIWMFAPSSQW